MAVRQMYPTKPIECWPKMKELRRLHHRRNQRIAENGGVVVVGVVQHFIALLAGLGEYASWQYEPRFTACMRDPELAIRNFDALEGAGFTPNICSALRIHMGSLINGNLLKALKGKKPDFVYQYAFCPFVVKTGLYAGEQLDVPVLTLDSIGRYRPGAVDAENYMAQMTALIERMEQVTGREYDDERLIEATRNEWECCRLWAEICYATQAIPAPLDMRMCQSLRVPIIVDRDKPEVVAFYRELRDEVKDRVAQGISARGREDARLTYEGFTSFHSPATLRWPEQYGAVFVASAQVFRSMSAWNVFDDGTWQPAQPPWERGLAMRTREDALRALLDLYLGDSLSRRSFVSVLNIRTRPQQVLRRVLDWHAAGVVMAMERACPIDSLADAEIRRTLHENNIPCVDFEPGLADVRQFNQTLAYNQITGFLEGLGLQRIAE